MAGGTLLAANGIFASWRIIDGGAPQQCGEGGHLTIAPDGSYALKAFANADTERIDFADAGCTSQPFAPFAEGRPFTNVNTIGFFEGGPIFGGIIEIEGENEHIAIAYDESGSERFRFGSTESLAQDGFGWFHAIEQCGDDICILDSNFRRLSIWTNEGEFRGIVDLSALFGLRYPWIPDFEVVGDGVAYFAASQERGDSDVFEGNIFRVSGLPGGDAIPAPAQEEAAPAEEAPPAQEEAAPPPQETPQPEANAPSTPARAPSHRAQVESAVQSAARGCYQRLGAHGQVSVQVSIGADGRVTTSRVVQNQTGNQEVGRCISGALVGRRFTMPRQATRTFTIPFSG